MPRRLPRERAQNASVHGVSVYRHARSRKVEESG